MNKKQLELFSDILSAGGYDCEMYSTSFDFIKDRSQVSEEEFLKIQFSYKSDIRNNNLEQRSNPLSPTYGIFGSSGTTGNKTFYKFSMNDRQVFDRIATRILSRVGANEKDLGVVCAPVLDDVRAHTMMWQYTAIGSGYVNCPDPSPENFMAVLKNACPTIVSGLPSALDFGLTRDFEIPNDSSIRLFLSGGNFFSNNKRKLVEQKWRLSWFDFLGVSEIFGPIMGECQQKHGLHYDKDLLIVEIINPETMQPITESEKIGILVITPLWNKGSPLVRYWTDDFAYRITEPCSCGEEGERIYVCGRKNDCLKIGKKYVFPREIEQILYGYSSDHNIYVDLTNENKIIAYIGDLNDEGKNALIELFECDIVFSTQHHFENINKPKPLLISDRIKRLFKG